MKIEVTTLSRPFESPAAQAERLLTIRNLFAQFECGFIGSLDAALDAHQLRGFFKTVGNWQGYDYQCQVWVNVLISE